MKREIEVSDKMEMLKNHLYLVKNIAKKIANKLPEIEREDVFSAASLGLMEAYNRYSHERASNFWTYAQNRVLGAIQDDLRKKDPLTRSQRKKVKIIEAIKKQYLEKYGREASLDEISEKSGLDIDEIFAVQNLKESVRFISFDSYETTESGQITNKIHAEDEMLPESAAIHEEQSRLLQNLVSKLPERERIVIELLYYSGKTPKEISAELGITEGRISQINKSAIQKLRSQASKF